MNYALCKNVMTDEKKRKGFDALIKQTFKLSFLEWYKNGEWEDWNQPYTLFDGDRAVANVTVNHMKVLYQGKIREYIQLGGVATDPEYRGQGLSRRIIEEVIKDQKDKCDAMFLMANRRVTEFYPKFGFTLETQYQYIWKKEKNEKIDNVANSKEKNDTDNDEINKNCANTSTYQNKVRKLDLSQNTDKELLKRCYEKRNTFSEFQFIDNFSLLQFYCYYGMDKNFYYIEEQDALVVAEQKGDRLLCFDVYYNGEQSLLQIMKYLVDENVQEIVFLFTPVHKEGLAEEQYMDDNTNLFVLSGKENVFADAKLYVPDISHT